MTQRPNRPRGISLIALLLLFFFVSAIGNLVVSRSMGSADVFPAGSPAAHFAAAISGPYFPSLVILYGLAALIAAVGMWRMRPWMPAAFLIWWQASGGNIRAGNSSRFVVDVSVCVSRCLSAELRLVWRHS
jgi:hypothetical protein